MNNNHVFWGVLFLLLAMSCKEEHGQDKYPDIPQFPSTSNSNIVIQPVLQEVDKVFYNDSVLICKHSSGESISFYSAKSGTINRIKSSVFIYGNGFFIVNNKHGEYEALNDVTLEKEPVKTIDESSRYKRMEDSLKKIFPQKSDYEISQVNDSLFINYFSSKYRIPKDKYSFTRELKKGDLYVNTSQDEFIIRNVPYSLDKFLNPLVKTTSKMIIPKFKRNFASLEDTQPSKSIFNEYDYAMTNKAWVFGGGGNHYIFSIPYMVESGYYYINISLGQQKGKFKIMSSSNPYFSMIPISINSQNYFVHNRQLYKVYTK